MSSVLKATIENKTTSSVTTHFKQLTTENNVFIVSVIVRSNCHILQFFTSNVECVRLVLDDALKQATPLTNGDVNETLRQFAPLSDDRLLQLVDCRESLTLIDHLLKGTPNRVIDWIQVRALWGPPC